MCYSTSLHVFCYFLFIFTFPAGCQPRVTNIYFDFFLFLFFLNLRELGTIVLSKCLTVLTFVGAQRVFTAAGWCLLDTLKTNYSLCIIIKESCSCSLVHRSKRSGCGYTNNTCKYNQIIVGFNHFMRFVENKKDT